MADVSVLLINDDIYAYRKVIKRGDLEQIATTDPMQNLYIPDNWNVLEGEGIHVVCVDRHRQQLALEMITAVYRGGEITKDHHYIEDDEDEDENSLHSREVLSLDSLIVDEDEDENSSLHSREVLSIDRLTLDDECFIYPKIQKRRYIPTPLAPTCPVYTTLQYDKLMEKIEIVSTTDVPDIKLGETPEKLSKSIRNYSGTIKAQQVVFDIKEGDKDLIAMTLCSNFTNFLDYCRNPHAHHVIQALILIQHPLAIECIKDLSNDVGIIMLNGRFTSRIIQRAIEMNYIADDILDNIIGYRRILGRPCSHVLETLIQTRPDYNDKVIENFKGLIFYTKMSRGTTRKIRNIIRFAMTDDGIDDINKNLPREMHIRKLEKYR